MLTEVSHHRPGTSTNTWNRWHLILKEEFLLGCDKIKSASALQPGLSGTICQTSAGCDGSVICSVPGGSISKPSQRRTLTVWQQVKHLTDVTEPVRARQRRLSVHLNKHNSSPSSVLTRRGGSCRSLSARAASLRIPLRKAKVRSDNKSRTSSHQVGASCLLGSGQIKKDETSWSRRV